MQMKNKSKILILGGNGFIGKNLAKTLYAQGYAVTCFDCSEPQQRTEGIHYITGDFFDNNQLNAIVKEHDIIYHAVSTINPGNSNRLYMQGYEKDFVQSVRLCEYIHQMKKKLIFLSSGGTVYGHHETFPVPEEAACHPINHYGTLKRCIESVMTAFRVQDEDRMIVARISNPYGPGQDFRKGVGVIDAILKNAINGTTMTIWGDGEVVRDYIYINDACAMLAALADYEGKEGIFNLSSGEGHTVNEIISIVRSIYPQLKVVYQEARSVDLKKIILDNNRIRKIYIHPLVSMEDGIRLFAGEIEAQAKIYLSADIAN